MVKGIPNPELTFSLPPWLYKHLGKGFKVMVDCRVPKDERDFQIVGAGLSLFLLAVTVSDASMGFYRAGIGLLLLAATVAFTAHNGKKLTHYLKEEPNTWEVPE